MSTVSKISFGSMSLQKDNQTLCERHRNRKRPLLESISSMTDEEIIRASMKKADSDIKKSTAARALEKGPDIFLAATAIGWGALTKGKLSDKVTNSAKALGAVALVGALSNPVHKTLDIIENKTPEDKKRNTFFDFALNTAALFGATCLAIKGLKTGKDALASKFEPTAKSIGNSLKTTAEKINSSSMGKITEEISNNVQNFANKHPKIANFAKNTAVVAPLAGFIGGEAMLAESVTSKRDEAFVSNVNKLSLCREFANKALGQTRE